MGELDWAGAGFHRAAARSKAQRVALSKRLAFDSSLNQVRYLLNRQDLTDDERWTINEALGRLTTLTRHP